MEGAGGAVVGHAEGEVVIAGRADVDRVAQPLAGVGVADVVAAARIGRRLDVDAGLAIGGAFVGGGRVVVGDAFPAAVEILDLDQAGDGGGRAGEGRWLIGRNADVVGGGYGTGGFGPDRIARRPQ